MNIIKIFFITSILVLFSACTDKTPFKEKEPISGAAQVYVYVSNVQLGMDESMQDSKYKLQINGKNVAGTIQAGEYKVFDMKPATVLFSSVRRNIEMMHAKLHLEAGERYYLKAQSEGFGEGYTFSIIEESLALQDLKTSTLAGSSEMDMTAYVAEFGGSTAKDGTNEIAPTMSEAEIDAIIEKKLQERGAPKAVVTPVIATPVVSTTSKLEDIKKAYDMKENGLLTEEEFKAMKAEILAK